MNISNLLNSRSVAEYWEEIDYKPDSLETALLVYSSRKLTFEQQCTRWEEIINTMPDATVSGSILGPYGGSLHAMLACYIKICRDFIRWFENDKNGVYTVTVFYDGDKFGTTLDAVFSSFEKARSYAAENAESDVFIINKLQADNDYPARLRLNKSFEPVFPHKWYLGFFNCSGYELVCFDFFDFIECDFPVPFKKGDVIYNPYWPDNKLFVVSSSEPGKALRGYSQVKSGAVSNITFGDMMGFEYYRGEFVGKQRIMKALSNYEKGLISMDLLLRAYHYIFCGEAQENELEVLSFVFEESKLELAGINLHENDGLNLSHRQ